jgi:hypothetical protein
MFFVSRFYTSVYICIVYPFMCIEIDNGSAAYARYAHSRISQWQEFLDGAGLELYRVFAYIQLHVGGFVLAAVSFMH